MNRSDIKLKIIEWNQKFYKIGTLPVEENIDIKRHIEEVSNDLYEFVSTAKQEDVLIAITFCLEISAQLALITGFDSDKLDDLIFIPTSMNILNHG